MTKSTTVRTAGEQFAMLTIDEAQAPTTAEAVHPGAGPIEPQPDWQGFALGDEPRTAEVGEARTEMVRAGDLMRRSGALREHETLPPDGRISSEMLFAAGCRLRREGLAMIPDERCPFRVKADDMIALLPERQADTVRFAYRSVQQTVAYLAAWLIQKDSVGESDLALIDSWLDENTPRGRNPLAAKAMVRWLLSRRRILSKRVKTRAASQLGRFVNKRASALDLLLRLTANAPQSTTRIANLEKLFPLMGLEPGAVHTELHRLAGGATKAAPQKTAATAATLDTARLQAIERNTLKVREMLGDVFGAEIAEPAAAERPKDVTETLYNKVKERPSWTLDEFAALAARYGLSAAAALENVNEYSYELSDEPLVEEEGDLLIVNA